MKKIIPLILVISAALASCTKKVQCDNAQLCVRNIGTDTIYYCWGCNSYDSTLVPGASACINVGEIEVSRSIENTAIMSFYSTHGSYAMEVDECFEKREIE